MESEKNLSGKIRLPSKISWYRSFKILNIYIYIIYKHNDQNYIYDVYTHAHFKIFYSYNETKKLIHMVRI